MRQSSNVVNIYFMPTSTWPVFVMGLCMLEENVCAVLMSGSVIFMHMRSVLLYYSVCLHLCWFYLLVLLVSERDVEAVSLIISQFFCVRLSGFASYLDAASVQEGSHHGSVVKNPPAVQEAQEMWVHSLGWKGPLEEEMATHSITLAWRIPWTEEPGGLQSMGLQRVGHDWSCMQVICSGPFFFGL